MLDAPTWALSADSDMNTDLRHWKEKADEPLKTNIHQEGYGPQRFLSGI